jgi:hypothetical protein
MGGGAGVERSKSSTPGTRRNTQGKSLRFTLCDSVSRCVRDLARGIAAWTKEFRRCAESQSPAAAEVLIPDGVLSVRIRGSAAISRCVYSCLGCENICSVLPDSTIDPW